MTAVTARERLHESRPRRAQALAAGDEIGRVALVQLLRAKLEDQARIAERLSDVKATIARKHKHEIPIADAIREQAASLDPHPFSELRKIESIAGRYYWQTWAHVPVLLDGSWRRGFRALAQGRASNLTNRSEVAAARLHARPCDPQLRLCDPRDRESCAGPSPSVLSSKLLEPERPSTSERSEMRQSPSVGASRLARTLLAATAVFLLTPAVAFGARVAVFDDPAFVNTGGTSSDESDTIQASLAAQGHAVDTFTGISAAAFSGGLAGNRLLVVPELEAGNLGAALSQEAVHTIRSYVATGGGLIVSAASANTTVFLNTVFGYSLAAGTGGVTSTRTAEVAGTSFAGGPASLAANNATRSLADASLPGGAATMYANGANATVVAFSYGNGEIVFLGWDWFDAQPVGTQDGGWLNVLNRAVAEVAGAGCTISGTPGPDTLVGTGGSDRICARGGNDTVTAGGGNDVVFAGEGGDTVNGQGGRDSILLEAGNDVGFGGPGNDRITGGPGRDRLNGNDGRDRLDSRDGVRGNDRNNGGPGVDTCLRDRRDRIRSC